MCRPLVVAIDGPAASGKSVVARRLAERLGGRFFDTGILYRALAWLALQEHIDPDDGARLAELASRLELAAREQPGGRAHEVRVLVSGEDITDRLAREDVERIVSRVSAHPAVRRALLQLQRDAAAGDLSVVAGRDIGTVVFPDAAVKVYLKASPAERARRRARQRGLEDPAEVGRVLAAILQRDQRDAGQMVPAADAVSIDTNGLSVEEVVDRVERLVRARSGGDHSPGCVGESRPSGA